MEKRRKMGSYPPSNVAGASHDEEPETSDGLSFNYALTSYTLASLSFNCACAQAHERFRITDEMQ